MSTVRVIGRGRAGRSLATALGRAGWGLGGVLGRADEVHEAAAGVDLLVIAVPDDAVAAVAASVAPVQTTVVAHMAGSLGLDVLAPHARRAHDRRPTRGDGTCRAAVAASPPTRWRPRG
jgi:hypothetical protein